MAGFTVPWGPPLDAGTAGPPPKAVPRPSQAPHIPLKPKSGTLDVGAYLSANPAPDWSARARSTRMDKLAHAKAPFPKQVSVYFPSPGVPPAPISAYGKPKAVREHFYQWNPTTTTAAHFRPDRWTMMINGRPMQATSQL